MANDDVRAVKANGHPQPWDTAKVRVAFTQICELVEALGADETADAYRDRLVTVIDDALGQPESEQQLLDRLAYLIYGATLFGLGALTAAEAVSKQSRSQIIARLEQSLDTWLERNPQGRRPPLF